jgi:RHS repeat-associated protein
LEYDGANTLQARYTHGPGIDEPIAVTKGSSTFFYHQDGLGTVTDLTDLAGATAKSYAYDAYGNVLESPGTVDQPYTYTGREFDAESGLLYYRARYYDATTGRFLQKDPIGFMGKDVNLYRYVRNNPIRINDPSGLVPAPPPVPSIPQLRGGGDESNPVVIPVPRIELPIGTITDCICPGPGSGETLLSAQVLQASDEYSCSCLYKDCSGVFFKRIGSIRSSMLGLPPNFNQLPLVPVP